MIWNIDPVLVDLGPLEIRYYGVFFALGLFLAYSLIRFMAKKKGLSLDIVENLTVVLLVGLIVGARLGHIVFYELDYYLANPIQILKVWEGGLASHGAAIGLLVAFGFFLWRHPKVRFLDYADVLVVGATIPVSLIRLGNFFNSELVGRVTEVPWAVVFERVDALSRHPSQLYEFGMGMLLFAILFPLWLKKYKTLKPGFFFGLFFMLYFAMRFSVEFFKDFPLHQGFLDLTTGQILSIPFFTLGFAVFLYSHAKKHS
ncbi:MAG: prolipoprotein diacylglyceryl transferase [Candidatus Gracilibacteria bacterium]|jgi:prolipoprotein diacylglyceryl transferase